MPVVSYMLMAIALLTAELVYFKIAERYNIVDKPNSRSSHTGMVIRGGGVIFILAVILWYVFYDYSYSYFMAGAILLAIMSFMDDLKPQNSLLRFGIQLIAVLLLFYSAGVFAWPVWLMVIACIVCIGTINAFNFMDGINGMTGLYAFVNLACFMYVHLYIVAFTHVALLAWVVLSVLIFLFFNFRLRARCFAGDVGSVTLAFLQIFLLVQLIVVTNNFFWVIMFLVYGVDSVVTIGYRLKNKENIFNAHRTHLYQYLSNELRWPQRGVAVLYGTAQLIINLVLFTCMNEGTVWIPVITSVAFVFGYLAVRRQVINKIKQSA